MRVGLDIGSTTIKCVVLNDAGQIVYSTYERHFSHILEKGRALLEKVAAEYLPDGRAYLAISGSAGMGLADSCRVPFVQEVFATRVAANRLTPGTDCIIELGGEDAKILFLTNGTEVRMNGSCAGGTGAFIDQMATLLHARGMRILARNWRSGPLELDLVCREGDTLVFVEVKTRGPGSLGSALDAVGPRKRQTLIRAARAWLAAHDQWHLPCRFDLVCIEPGPTGPHMEHIRHAFDLSGSGPSVDRGHASWQPW